jgi:hypothetical protein
VRLPGVLVVEKTLEDLCPAGCDGDGQSVAAGTTDGIGSLYQSVRYAVASGGLKHRTEFSARPTAGQLDEGEQRTGAHRQQHRLRLGGQLASGWVTPLSRRDRQRRLGDGHVAGLSGLRSHLANARLPGQQQGPALSRKLINELLDNIHVLVASHKLQRLASPAATRDDA